MKRWFIFISMTVIFLHLAQAGLLDFKTLKDAKTAYEAKKYEKAARLYHEVARSAPESPKGQKALFDAADAYYKAGEYEKALKTYQKVTLPELQHKKWHNIGNCYAQLKKIDEGIEAYEKALKIKKDEATRFNLELLKKLKRQQKKQKKNRQNKKRNQKQNNRHNQQKQNNNQHQNNTQNGQNNQNDRRQQGDKNRQQNQNGQNEQNQKGDQKRKEQKGDNQHKKGQEGQKGNRAKPAPSFAKQKRGPMGKEPISDMELRKWERMLNRRAVNTLMMPLPTKSEKRRSHDETKPW